MIRVSAAQRLDLGQDAPDAAFNDAQRGGRYLASAGDLGAHVAHLGARRCRGQGVVAQRGIDEVGDGRAKRAQHLDALR